MWEKLSLMAYEVVLRQGSPFLYPNVNTSGTLSERFYMTFQCLNVMWKSYISVISISGKPEIKVSHKVGSEKQLIC